MLVVAMALPWAAGIATSTNHFLLNMDPTVLSLSATAIFGYLVLSQKVLDIGELAREQFLMSMRDGYIAVDGQQCVVEVNERALQLLEMPLAELLERPVDGALADRKSLLDANEEQAVVIAERVLAALTADAARPASSMSAGVAQITPDDSLLHAIAAADRALYVAKARGRDRVI